MKSVKHLLIVLGMFCIAEGYGQVNLRIDTITFPSTIHLHDSISLSVTIHNDSFTTFVGKISFMGLIDSFVETADTSDAVGSTLVYPSGNTIESITFGSSITRSLIVHVNNPPFIIGSSGVVIWPIVTSSSQVVHISDTLYTQVTVLYPVGIDEITDRKLKVYLSNEQLMIQNNGTYLLRNVRLYDIAGKLLDEQQITTSGALNMGQYPIGVYFAEINFADNTRAVVKVVNTK